MSSNSCGLRGNPRTPPNAAYPLVMKRMILRATPTRPQPGWRATDIVASSSNRGVSHATQSIRFAIPCRTSKSSRILFSRQVKLNAWWRWQELRASFWRVQNIWSRELGILSGERSAEVSVMSYAPPYSQFSFISGRHVSAVLSAADAGDAPLLLALLPFLVPQLHLGDPEDWPLNMNFAGSSTWDDFYRR